MAMINHSPEVRWKSGAIKPPGMTMDFCGLMNASGCEYVGLSIETASEKMLENMHRGYRVDDKGQIQPGQKVLINGANV